MYRCDTLNLVLFVHIIHYDLLNTFTLTHWVACNDIKEASVLYQISKSLNYCLVRYYYRSLQTNRYCKVINSYMRKQELTNTKKRH